MADHRGREAVAQDVGAPQGRPETRPCEHASHDGADGGCACQSLARRRQSQEHPSGFASSASVFGESGLTPQRLRAIDDFVRLLRAMRAAILLLYVAGLIGPCLSRCFAPTAHAASHDCCPKPSSGEVVLSVPTTDCCASVAHAKPLATAIEVPLPAAIDMPRPADADGVLAASFRAVLVPASPPLVLRI